MSTKGMNESERVTYAVPTLEPGLHVIDVPQRESNYEGDGD